MNTAYLITFLLLPFLGGIMAFSIRKPHFPRRILRITALAEFLLMLYPVYRMFFNRQALSFPLGSLLGIDWISAFFLMVTNLLFCLVSFQIPAWIHADERAIGNPHANDFRMREPLFCCFTLLFLGTMTIVICSRNFGLLWVAVEATTLASAPLICYHRSGHALEAMWKYLLICSVGIAFALLGTMCLSVAAVMTEGTPIHSLSFDAFFRETAGPLHPSWFKAAFVLILAGYGTKMGLVPFHTWLPDAHSESPAVVSALLSGTLLNCAFLGILRMTQIAPDALVPFCNNLLITFGILSVSAAALFIIRQTDYKRMLAYSSVEHMGLIAIAWGLNLTGATFFHIAGHTLIKGLLFLTAGNILLTYGTRSVSLITGMAGRIPRNAMLWLFGLLMICGTPPSPLFVTEFILVRQTFLDGRFWMGGILLFLLLAVFAGMSSVFYRMLCGTETPAPAENSAASERLTLVPAILAVLAVLFGAALTLFLVTGGIL